ncbi:unnamed protein product [Gongylonema pulchrum]|uniref:FZ domain-containing protein n=1 Tax=Gongylonema pulchrum TaxID=637853 RepID=A0A183ECS2_9BILA|nr:unnamed protein product [Gongylonema pulchrum]
MTFNFQDDIRRTPPALPPASLKNRINPFYSRSSLSNYRFPPAVYALYPSLLPKDNASLYCSQASLQFQSTCVQGKKLRYDLKNFCQEYADTCAVPNNNNYPDGSDGRPYGHGQKQTGGAVGVGSSYALGLGPVPGFEVVSSQGVDVGPVPGLDEIGGLVVNRGAELGILGERIGPGPARTIDGLERGFPSLDPLSPTNHVASAEFQKSILRSLGLGNLPGLGRLFGGRSSGKPKGPRIRGYEPGYGAVNKKALIATGKTDTDSVALPAIVGELELNKGVGLGIG